MNQSEKRNIEEYRQEELPSDRGAVVEPLKGKATGFIPKEAIDASEKARAPEKPDSSHGAGNRKEKLPADPFAEEKVAKCQPPLDSSEETLGG